MPLLLKVCSEAQTAVNRQAQALEGKRTLRPGPVIASVSRECTLELFGLKKGSTTLNFARAAEQGMLVESQSMSFEVVAGVATAIKEVARKRGRTTLVPDIGVLDTLHNLGDAFDKGISKIDWIVPAQRNETPSCRIQSSASNKDCYTYPEAHGERLFNHRGYARTCRREVPHQPCRWIADLMRV